MCQAKIHSIGALFTAERPEQRLRPFVCFVRRDHSRTNPPAEPAGPFPRPLSPAPPGWPCAPQLRACNDASTVSALVVGWFNNVNPMQPETSQLHGLQVNGIPKRTFRDRQSGHYCTYVWLLAGRARAGYPPWRQHINTTTSLAPCTCRSERAAPALSPSRQAPSADTNSSSMSVNSYTALFCM